MKAMDKVIGYANIKIELERICDVLKNPGKYEKLGIKEPKGLMISGEPGVGKSLISECFIDDVGRKSYIIRKTKADGDFIDFIKKTFDDAKENAPSIVLLDDLDKFDNEGLEKVNAEAYVTIQSCIDEVKNEKVFVIATVNNLSLLPESLKRDGRFDKRIYMKKPKGDDAIKIVDHYLKKIPYVGDISAKHIARILDGCSCATLKNVINEAGIRAGFKNKEKIEMDDILMACMRIIYNAPECLENVDDKYAENIAYHEAGHAVIQEVLEPGSVNIVSILKNEGDIGGVTSSTQDENYFNDIDYMENRVLTLLGGKAATEIKYGKTDVGATSDLRRAFRVVSRFVADYCKNDFSAFVYDDQSTTHANNRDDEVANEMSKYYQKAKKILTDNAEFLVKLASELEEKKILIYSDILRIKNEVKVIKT